MRMLLYVPEEGRRLSVLRRVVRPMRREWEGKRGRGSQTCDLIVWYAFQLLAEYRTIDCAAYCEPEPRRQGVQTGRLGTLPLQGLC